MTYIPRVDMNELESMLFAKGVGPDKIDAVAQEEGLVDYERQGRSLEFKFVLRSLIVGGLAYGLTWFISSDIASFAGAIGFGSALVYQWNVAQEETYTLCRALCRSYELDEKRFLLPAERHV